MTRIESRFHQFIAERRKHSITTQTFTLMEIKTVEQAVLVNKLTKIDAACFGNSPPAPDPLHLNDGEMTHLIVAFNATKEPVGGLVVKIRQTDNPDNIGPLVSLINQKLRSDFGSDHELTLPPMNTVMLQSVFSIAKGAGHKMIEQLVKQFSPGIIFSLTRSARFVRALEKGFPEGQIFVSGCTLDENEYSINPFFALCFRAFFEFNPNLLLVNETDPYVQNITAPLRTLLPLICKIQVSSSNPVGLRGEFVLPKNRLLKRRLFISLYTAKQLELNKPADAPFYYTVPVIAFNSRILTTCIQEAVREQIFYNESVDRIPPLWAK